MFADSSSKSTTKTVGSSPAALQGNPSAPTASPQRVRQLGVTKTARYAAFHDLVTQIPSPLLAGLLGYNPVVIATRAEALASTWQTYASLTAEPDDKITTASSPGHAPAGPDDSQRRSVPDEVSFTHAERSNIAPQATPEGMMTWRSPSP